jgi:hypothetical protein
VTVTEDSASGKLFICCDVILLRCLAYMLVRIVYISLLSSLETSVVACLGIEDSTMGATLIALGANARHRQLSGNTTDK